MAIRPPQANQLDITALYHQFDDIRKHIEIELIQTAEQLTATPNPQKDYQRLAREGIQALQRRIAQACATTLCPCSQEAFIARVVIGNAEKAFGEKLNSILRKTPQNLEVDKDEFCKT